MPRTTKSRATTARRRSIAHAAQTVARTTKVEVEVKDFRREMADYVELSRQRLERGKR